MKHKNEKGFSLIELLIVVVIIGIIASISVTYLMRAQMAAENRAAVGTLAAVRSAQTAYFAQNKRFARMDELLQSQGVNLGVSGTQTSFRRGKFSFVLTSPIDDASLRNQYTITATRDNDNPFTFVYTLDESGVINGIEVL